MKAILLPIVLVMLALGLCTPCSAAVAKAARDVGLPGKVLAHAGETYTGFQDPGFIAYDRDLREALVSRIKKKFGITLDPQIYDGFELLEIESLLKCRKSNETPDLVVGRFNKRR